MASSSESSLSSSCFYPNISGEEAETILKSVGKHGSFLLRLCNQVNGHHYYTLSVMSNKHIIHFKMQCNNDCYSIRGEGEFESPYDVIQNCMENPDILKEKDGNIIELKQPVVNSKKPTRWYHGNIHHTDAERVLNENGKHGSFLVRASYRHPGDYALCVRLKDEILCVKIYANGEKFDIGAGKQFKSISELILHYKKYPLKTSTGVDIHLDQGIDTDSIKQGSSGSSPGDTTVTSLGATSEVITDGNQKDEYEQEESPPGPAKSQRDTTVTPPTTTPTDTEISHEDKQKEIEQEDSTNDQTKSPQVKSLADDLPPKTADKNQGESQGVTQQEFGQLNKDLYAMANDNGGKYIFNFQGTSANGVQGGLVKAHEKVISLDGTSPQDKSCQFHLHKRFHKPQYVYRFESVKYRCSNLYWDGQSKRVYLWDSSNGTGMDDDLANVKHVWWVIADCSGQPDCKPGSKLLEPFNFPGDGTAPYYLVFEDSPKITQRKSTAIKSGLMLLTEIKN